MGSKRNTRMSSNVMAKIISNKHKDYGISSLKVDFVMLCNKNGSNNEDSFTIIPVKAEENQENKNNIVFSIQKEMEDTAIAQYPYVFRSYSDNFFIINKKPLRRGQKRILLNDDVISVTKNASVFFTFCDMRKPIDTQFKSDLMKNYFVEKLLGQGANGYTFLVHNIRTLDKLAVKKVEKDNAEPRDDYVFEAKILNTLNHPNIVRLMHAHDEVNHTYLFTEYLNCQDLLNFIKMKDNARLEESDAKDFFRQIAQGLEYLHNLNICHRDIKCDNIFMHKDKNKYVCKIGDFGLSSYDNNLKHGCGTLLYCAPEMLRKDVIYKGTKCDIWSLGVVLFCMLSGKFPFHETFKSAGTLHNQIMNGVVCFRSTSIWNNISYKAKHMICCMINRHPFLRYNIDEIMNHEWLQDLSEKTDVILRKRPINAPILLNVNDFTKALPKRPKIMT